MNEIKPTYATFEQSKLLKEKGFDVPCKTVYDGNYEPHHTNIIHDISFKSTNSELEDNCYSAPEQWQIIEWVFQKYQYSIEVNLNIPESGEYDGCYVFNGIIKGSEDYKLKIVYKSKDYPTREKATSAAIDYILKELI
jgi:hypothetical protein